MSHREWYVERLTKVCALSHTRGHSTHTQTHTLSVLYVVTTGISPCNGHDIPMALWTLLRVIFVPVYISANLSVDQTVFDCMLIPLRFLLLRRPSDNPLSRPFLIATRPFSFITLYLFIIVAVTVVVVVIVIVVCMYLNYTYCIHFSSTIKCIFVLSRSNFLFDA